MTFYLAKGLAKLRSELNTQYPRRDHSSDGWVGDTSHAARKSDHNPDYSRGGVVRAIDVDKDGIHANLLVEFLVAKIKAHSPRCDGGCYVIFNGVIWTATNNGRAAVYTGTNKHTHHIHFSICNHANHYDSTTPWYYGAWLKRRLAPKPAPAPTHPAYPGTRLVRGTRSGAVGVWQTQMKKRGWAIDVDNYFGPQSCNVALQFRKEKKLGERPEVDKPTWDAAWTAPR